MNKNKYKSKCNIQKKYEAMTKMIFIPNRTEMNHRVKDFKVYDTQLCEEENVTVNFCQTNRGQAKAQINGAFLYKF